MNFLIKIDFFLDMIKEEVDGREVCSFDIDELFNIISLVALIMQCNVYT
ncbi:MAG: hypothetical protein LJI21_00545 [Wolbachia endosymbiont of Menacanthus eurysternus]|nr:MAG: hypothetical protein LJI21_00545 [Wolbachia endosymbiont of Menacanthus eurysternus]